MDTTELSNPLSVSVSHSFALQWNLNINHRRIFSKCFTEWSDLYKFRTLENLYLYLQIKSSRQRWNLRVVGGSEKWSFKIARAFLVCKDRAFALIQSNELSFLDAFESSYLSGDEEITLHCLVNACPVPPAPDSKEDDPSTKEDGPHLKDLPLAKEDGPSAKEDGPHLKDDPSAKEDGPRLKDDPSAKEDGPHLKDDQNLVVFEGMLNFGLPSKFRKETIDDFLLRGHVPYLTVDKAIQIVRETTYLECERCKPLKFLCAEYLMKNITAKYLRVLARISIECRLPSLEMECMAKIASGALRISKT